MHGLAHCYAGAQWQGKLEMCLPMLQAESLGSQFRNIMYPRYGPAGGGLLRLHSTYRHDLKIYSSDEGRVQSSAAAFTQVGLSGLLAPLSAAKKGRERHPTASTAAASPTSCAACPLQRPLPDEVQACRACWTWKAMP